MIVETKVGIITAGDGTVSIQRASRDGSTIVGDGMGRYQEMAQRGLMFTGGNQGPGGTTTTVGLATTYTGLCLSNPAGNTKNFALLQASLGIVGAPAALSTFGLLAGYAAGGVTAHTTPLVPQCTLLSASAVGTAKIDSAATLVGSPFLYMAFGVTPITGATAQVVNPPVIGNLYDIGGSLIIPPGGYVGIYTSTVVTVIASFVWTEVAV
jgi:hypothetical protein